MMKLGSRLNIAGGLLLSTVVSAYPTTSPKKATTSPKNGTYDGYGGLPVVDLGYEKHQAIAFNVS
jgi:hypothetical protein